MRMWCAGMARGTVQAVLVCPRRHGRPAAIVERDRAEERGLIVYDMSATGKRKDAQNPWRRLPALQPTR